MSEAMWEAYGRAKDIAVTRWPCFDFELACKEEIEVTAQVNDKLRSRLFASPDPTDDDLRHKSLVIPPTFVNNRGQVILTEGIQQSD